MKMLEERLRRVKIILLRGRGWVNPALSLERAVPPSKMAGCMNNAG